MTTQNVTTQATQAPTVEEGRAIVREALLAAATGKAAGPTERDLIDHFRKAAPKGKATQAPKTKAAKKAPSGPQAATKGKDDPKPAKAPKKAAGAKQDAPKAKGKKDPAAKAPKGKATQAPAKGKAAKVGKGKTITAKVAILKKDGTPKRTNLGMTFPAGKLTQKDRTYRVYLATPVDERVAGNAVAIARKARVNVAEATAKTWLCWWNNGVQIPRLSRDLKDPQARKAAARRKAKAAG